MGLDFISVSTSVAVLRDVAALGQVAHDGVRTALGNPVQLRYHAVGSRGHGRYKQGPTVVAQKCPLRMRKT